MIPVVLSGGSGSRLWPLSRDAKPKQFLSLTDEHTMLQNTLRRGASCPGAKPPIVVCNENHRFLVAEQLRQINSPNQGIILEPSARDTAPAITVAALHALRTGGDESILILPSDHVISNINGFHEAIEKAESLADGGYLVTFGVKPVRAETGYGYIKSGKSVPTQPDTYCVDSFVEKPDSKTAGFLASQEGYYWNSGVFLFRPTRLLEELKNCYPDIFRCCEAALNAAEKDLDFVRLNSEEFLKNPSISFDYAVMEKAHNTAVVPLDCGWCDIGSYNSLWEVLRSEENGNVTKGDVTIHDCADSLAIAESRLVSVLGLNDVIVVETRDAVMVAHKNSVQDIKGVVESLKSSGRPEATEYKQGFRQWGTYDCVDSGNRFQVKRITVKPGGKLSLQRHQHRSEHWIVVSGTAKVRCGDKVQLLSENESTYIPVGEIHQLGNPGRIELEVIEVQSGSYLGEDDIERYEDSY